VDEARGRGVDVDRRSPAPTLKDVRARDTRLTAGSDAADDPARRDCD
jgi:hypothetical protein